jgi:hypothetical protein
MLFFIEIDCPDFAVRQNCVVIVFSCYPANGITLRFYPCDVTGKNPEMGSGYIHSWLILCRGYKGFTPIFTMFKDVI